MTRPAYDDASSMLVDTLDRLREDDSADAPHLEHALYAPAREFVARPGKALRARLIDGCFRLAGGPASGVPAAAVEAIELLHGGSLIIDDIQDDAEVRRGAPALHRLIGTPRALNTGNWLYFVALAQLDELPLDSLRARELTRAAHLCLARCHEGQALDLSIRVGELRRAELPALSAAISGLKTGALTGFAAQLGAIAAGAPSQAVAALAHFGKQVGVSLQMLDDLGAFVAESRHHKALEDLRGQRLSWVWTWASETLDALTLKQLMKQLTRDGELELVRARLADAAEPLGRQRVHAALAQAASELDAAFPHSHARDAMHAELTRLENSYG